MKMTKLLTGVAGAALLAGAAHGQVDVTITLDDDVAAGAMQGQVELATELDADSTSPTAFEFTVVPDAGAGGFSSFNGSAATIVLNLSGAVFATAVTDGDILQLGACDPQIVDGGLAGESSVTLEVSDIGLCDTSNADLVAGTVTTTSAAPFATQTGIVLVAPGTQLSLEPTNAQYITLAGSATIATTTLTANQQDEIIAARLPIQLTSTTANLSVDISQKSNGAPIASASYERAVAYTIGSSFESTDLIIGIPGFITSVAAASGIEAELDDPAYNTLSSSTLGSIAFTNLAADVDLSGTAASFGAPGQVDGVEVVVSFANASGLEAVTLTANNGDTTTAEIEDGEATFTITPTASTGVDTGELTAGAVSVSVSVDDDDDTLINETTFSIAVSVEEDSASDLTIGGDSDAELITRDGSQSALFRWVGDSSKSTANFFRFTGFDPDEELPSISFSISNASADDSSDLNKEYALGEYEVSAGGELILNVADLEEVVGEAWGRADVRFFVEGPNVQVRRLQVTEGVVTLGNDG